MTLFLTLLPIYLFGNLHCAGMCGPLMVLLAKNPYKWAYFLGRTVSYSLAGLLSAEVGLLFFHVLSRYHLSAFLSLIFGLCILLLSLLMLFRLPNPLTKWFTQKTTRLSTWLAKILNLHGPYPIFLFGVCTLLLPCGQTLIVFSACALDARPSVGFVNGFVFALLTSPSLIISLSAFKRLRNTYHYWMGGATLIVGLLAVFRGLADLAWISHLILNPHSSTEYHIVLY